MNNIYNNIIAGPCSIESKEQFLKTIDELNKYGFYNIRGGVWKPRTKPGGFEGLGEKALEFTKGISDSKIFCEVANKEQLEIAIKYNVSGIWIGARTTVDPFAVQEIADTLNNYDDIKKHIIVMVKNPVCPDLELWEGAIQRLMKAGIPEDNIIAIFRGFKVYNQTKYRNEPIWRIPLELKTRNPKLKMYIDPSHIAGDSKYIEEILDIAINIYDYDGAIIECHCDPNNAWTDAKQQIKPEELKSIIDKVTSKQKNNNNKNQSELDIYRKAIDTYDENLLNILSARLDVSKKIGEYKKKNNMKLFQKDRWASLLENITKLGKSKGLDENYVSSIWEIIHEKSIDVQK